MAIVAEEKKAELASLANSSANLEKLLKQTSKRLAMELASRTLKVAEVVAEAKDLQEHVSKIYGEGAGTADEPTRLAAELVAAAEKLNTELAAFKKTSEALQESAKTLTATEEFGPHITTPHDEAKRKLQAFFSSATSAKLSLSRVLKGRERATQRTMRGKGAKLTASGDELSDSGADTLSVALRNAEHMHSVHLKGRGTSASCGKAWINFFTTASPAVLGSAELAKAALGNSVVAASCAFLDNQKKNYCTAMIKGAAQVKAVQDILATNLSIDRAELFAKMGPSAKASGGSPTHFAALF